jgi:hypothetical protein
MDTYQCPECELKFRFETELKQHLSLEHPDFKSDPKTVEDALLSDSRRPRPAQPPRSDSAR